MAKLKIGWSQVDISPEKRVSLEGQFAERISEYIEKPLTVTAMAVECGNDQMVLVSCDLVSISYILSDRVKKELEGNRFGLDTSRIMIHAIHTHTAYGTGGGRRIDNGINTIKSFRLLLESCLKPGQKYIEKVTTSGDDIQTVQEGQDRAVSGIVKAITEAWMSRDDASFANAFDRAAVGLCRRVDYSDGTAQMWGNANTACFTEVEGGNDSGVELLYFFDKNRKLKGIAANVACPAQCVQHRLFVSPDYWGETRKLVKEYFGEEVFLLPLCSAAGDQCPVDLVRWVNPDTDVHDPNLIRHNPPVRKADPSMFDLEGMKKAGKRVFNAIRDAWEEGVGDPQEDIKFEHCVHMMQLPVRRCTLSEYNESVKAVRDFIRNKDGDVDYMDVAGLQKYLGIINRFTQQETVNVIDTEVHVIRMGSVSFASFPFELFLDYGNQIRARAFSEQTFLVQQCNGKEGYLPTKKAEEHGHYSAMIASGTCGHEAGDLLVRQILKDINRMFDGDCRVYEYKE